MYQKDFYEDYFIRISELNNLKTYRKPILGSTTKDSRKLITLFLDIFSHHVKPMNLASSELRLLYDDNRRYISSDNLNANFLDTKYKIPQIFYNTISLDDIDSSNEIEFNEFIKEFTEQSQTSENWGSNRVSYLIGDIGEGKSVFISKITRTMILNLDSYKKIPVYIDIEKLFFDKSINKLKDININKLTDHIILLIIQIVKKLLPNINLEQFTKAGIGRGLFELLDLINYLRTYSYETILLFDNIDGYHFYHSKHIFDEQEELKKQESISNNIRKLIDFVSEEQYLGIAGLSTLLVCREYVYYEYRNSQTQDLQSSELDGAVYRLKPSLLSDVLSSRIELFNEATELIIEQYEGFRDNIEEFRLSLRKNLTVEFDKTLEIELFPKNAWNDILKLSHHGYRSLINFIGQLQFDITNENVRKRIFENPKGTLLSLYMLDMQGKYTQQREHFPNIFLIDGQIQKKNSCNLYQPHTHTYWLKYLLLSYILKSKRTTATKLVNVFSKKFNSIYEEHLVKLTLGSLVTINEFQCIKFENDIISTKSLMENVVLTKRGEYILSNDNIFKSNIPFCFHAYYLELMLEDFLLAVPEFICDKIKCSSNNLHLLKNDDNFIEPSIKTIKEKALKSLYFLYILKSSYYAEKSYRHELFNFLIKEKYLQEPNFKYIKEEIIKHYIHFNEIFPLNLTKEYLNNEWKKWEKNDDLLNWFKDFYRKDIKVECLQ